MASPSNRVRLPSISELTSSTSKYIPSLSPRIKDDRALKDLPNIGTNYKYPSKPVHVSSNYILGNNNYQRVVSPVAPPASFEQIPEHQPHQPHQQLQALPPHIQQVTISSQHEQPIHQHIPPPPPAPAHAHAHAPGQQYHSPPTHYHSPPTHYPQYIPAFHHPGHMAAQVVQGPPPPPPQQLQRHQGYYQPIYFQHGATVAGTQFATPEVINKPNNKCHRCGTTETPEWRRGPNGVRTLCNACGLFHAKLVKRKGAALAAEEVLNNKVCKGKNGRRISIKSEMLKNEKIPTMHQQGLPPIMGQGFPQYSVPSMVRH